MSLVEENVRIWNQVYTDHALTIEYCEEQAKRSGWQCTTARDGHLIDVSIQQHETVVMQSQYRPIDEARRYVKQFEGLKQDSCILFLGMGNGYILRELLQYPQVQYVCYEPSLAYFCHVMCHYDLTDLILEDTIRIYVKDINQSDLSLHMYKYVHALNWPVFYLDFMPKYQQLYTDEISYVETLYQKSRDHALQNYGSAKRFAISEMQNAIYNLRYMYHANSIAQYRGLLQNIPVIMVAAGPSLEKNIDLLEKYRDRAFIICVDHAVPMLSKHGIVPHAYMTVDAGKDPDMFQDAKGAPWFVYTTSNHEAIQVLHDPKLIFTSTLYGYAEHIFQLAGSDLFEMASGGSVATNAVQTALYMGSQKIILIGQDLALTDNKLYAGLDVNNIEQGQAVSYITSFYGGQVLTRADFKSYIDYYEALANQRKDVTFINATEGGAYIEGMQHMTLEAAMEQYGLAEPFDGDALLDSIPPLMTPDKQKLVLEDYHGLMSYFKKVQREVKSAITWTQRGVRLLEQTNYENPELAKVEQTINRFQDIYNSHPGKSILDMGVGREIQDALLDIRFTKENLTEELMRLYQKMLTFYKGVESCVTDAIPILNEVLDEIEKQAD